MVTSTPRVIALANNDVVQLFWTYPTKRKNCLGFAVFRREVGSTGPWDPLPAWVGFKGQSNKAWQSQPTTVWPIQKYSWKDLTATRGKSYHYRIEPVRGTPAAGKPLTPDGTACETTDPVTLTPERGSFHSYFNRGILSTQFLVHQIPAGPKGAPNYKTLKNRIDQPGDPLRNALAGQILEGLKLLLDLAAAKGGSLYAALYELTDPELLQALLKAKNLHLILSNTGTDDGENKPARQALHETAGIEILDRFVPSGHIGHNKFCVYVDPQGRATQVLLGSTNWTDTGVCAQSNNALIARNEDIAAAYWSYWQRLKTDTIKANAKQAAPLRSADAKPGAADVPVDTGKATVWFSPNTPKQRASKLPKKEATPVDLQEVFGLMDAAKRAILFLEFQPGSPSVVDRAAAIQKARPDLFVRGAVTDPKAADAFEKTVLIHRSGAPMVTVVPATAVNDQFSYWEKELLKAGPQAHAIIHDKIVVIDPMTPDCVVVTGSHNQGYRASYNNDENLLIVQGHQPLAQAYAVHVLDVYDHYRFRYILSQKKNQAFSGLEKDDRWQDKYFDPKHPASSDGTAWF